MSMKTNAKPEFFFHQYVGGGTLICCGEDMEKIE
jgi:hypothetical protein